MALDTNSKTTLTFQPIVGLGLLNGGRIGLGVKLNEIVAIEAGVGFDFAATIGIIFFFLPIDKRGYSMSQGIVITPFNEKRFSLILYNAINSNKLSSMGALQIMAGWKIPIGASTALRMSGGYAKKYQGNSDNYDDIIVGLDFVLTLGNYKVLL
jgi:hypothetical protein